MYIYIYIIQILITEICIVNFVKMIFPWSQLPNQPYQYHSRHGKKKKKAICSAHWNQLGVYQFD